MFLKNIINKDPLENVLAAVGVKQHKMMGDAGGYTGRALNETIVDELSQERKWHESDDPVERILNTLNSNDRWALHKFSQLQAGVLRQGVQGEYDSQLSRRGQIIKEYRESIQKFEEKRSSGGQSGIRHLSDDEIYDSHIASRLEGYLLRFIEDQGNVDKLNNAVKLYVDCLNEDGVDDMVEFCQIEINSIKPEPKNTGDWHIDKIGNKLMTYHNLDIFNDDRKLDSAKLENMFYKTIYDLYEYHCNQKGHVEDIDLKKQLFTNISKLMSDPQGDWNGKKMDLLGAMLKLRLAMEMNPDYRNYPPDHDHINVMRHNLLKLAA